MSDTEIPSNKTTILVLGGYGNTGRRVVPLLLEYTTADIIVAGRSLEKAKAYVASLDVPSRVAAAQVDAADRASLRSAFQEHAVNLVLVTSSTSDYVQNVTEAALEAKVDYFDIHFGTEANTVLQSIESEITNAGLCFITDGGFHPGLPAALVRHVAASFDGTLESAHVGSVLQIDWKQCAEHMSPNTAAEFAGEIGNMSMLVYKHSEWKDEGFLTPPLTMDFGAPFGRRSCFPMFLEEMRAIPQLYPSVTETGFYASGFHWVVDYGILPLVLLAVKLFPQRAKRPMGQLLLWGLQTFVRPPFGTRLQVEARGTGPDGTPRTTTLRLSVDDAYQLTALAVVATVLQYLSATASIRRPGWHRQGLLVDPPQLLRDLQRMGVTVEPPVVA